MPKTVLINPSGREVEVDEDAIPYLTRLGYKEKAIEQTMAEEAEASRKAYYSTPTQKLKTVGEGLASGATLNLIEPLIDDEETRGRAEFNPGLRKVGEFGGAIIPALATGGESAAAKLLGANPAGLIERGAEVVGGRLAKSKVGQFAISGGLEGFAGAAGQNVANALMGDPVTQDSVVSSLGLGTLLGAGVGAVGGKIAQKLDGDKLAPGVAKRLEGQNGLRAFDLENDATVPDFGMPSTNKIPAEGLPDVQVKDFDARVANAHEQAKNHVYERIQKQRELSEKYFDEGGRRLFDLKKQMADTVKDATKTDEDILSLLPPDKKAAYVKVRAAQNAQPVNENFDATQQIGFDIDEAAAKRHAAFGGPSGSPVYRWGEEARGDLPTVAMRGDDVDTKGFVNEQLPLELPEGFRNHGQFTTRARIKSQYKRGVPDFDGADAKDIFVLRPSELDDFEVYGSPLKDGSSERVAANWGKEKTPPIEVDVTPDGKYWVVDGNHRLAVASNDNRPIAVQFRKTDKPPLSNVVRREGKAIDDATQVDKVDLPPSKSLDATQQLDFDPDAAAAQRHADLGEIRGTNKYKFNDEVGSPDAPTRKFRVDPRKEALESILSKEEATAITRQLEANFKVDENGMPGIDIGDLHPDTKIDENLPEFEAGRQADEQMLNYQRAAKLLESSPDFSYRALAKMPTEKAIAHAAEFFEKLNELAPDVAKIYEEGFANAFGGGAITPAELGLHFKMSSDALEKLGNAGAAKNFAAAWATIRGVEKPSKLGTDSIAEAINRANDAASDPFAAIPEGEPSAPIKGKKGKKGSGIVGRAAKIAAGRKAASIMKGSLIGGAMSHALGYGLVESLLAGGMLGGAGNRIRNLSKTLTKKSLELAGKAFIGKGRGLAASYLTTHEALSTPYTASEDRNSFKGMDEKELFKMRRDQALKHQGQYAVDAAAEILGPVAEHSPELAQKLRDSVVAKANYLANAAPKDPPWAAFDPDYFPSEEEIERFAMTWRTVTEPVSILRDLAGGYIDPAQAACFRETSPELFAVVAEFMFTHVDFNKLDYEQSLNASILLDRPVNADIMATADFQASFLEEGGGQGQAQAAQAIKSNFQMPEDGTESQMSTER